MSIVANSKTRVLIQGGPAAANAARRMSEFCHLSRLPLTVQAFVFPPDAGKTVEIPYGGQLISIPVYKTVADATSHHPEVNTSLVYVGPDRAYGATIEALTNEKIKLVSMITEGVPEKDTKLLTRKARELGKVFNGPSAIGIISAGECRLGVIGGSFDNLVLSKLYRPGSFGVITKSGGLSNEIIWILSQFADGVTTAIGIGGDVYPGSDYVTYLEMFENDPKTHAVVIVGEMGGDLEEKAAEWFGAKKRRIRLLAVISGFCQETLPKGMKFGHAGAKEGLRGEGSARHKVELLRKAGAIVPDTFGGLGPAIKEVHQELIRLGEIQPVQDVPIEKLPKLPMKIEESVQKGEVFIDPLIKTTISDDRGEEPLYYGYPASELINKGYDISHIIGLLWNKRLAGPQEAEVLKRIIMLSADHGPAVPGALTTIIAACAGIGMSQAVAAGLIMIGPRFGGAVTDAGKVHADISATVVSIRGEVHQELIRLGEIQPVQDVPIEKLPKLPMKIEESVQKGEVFIDPLIKTTISDDRGEEPLYYGYPASELINKGYDISHIIGLLWNKRLAGPQEAEVLKRIIMLSADHGPAVPGALTTIIAACAGIGMSQAVAAGLIMIGPRFGGAVTDAGKWFKYAVKNKLSVEEFLSYMKANVGPVPGIGHRVKSVRNPDKRVKELVKYVKSIDIPTAHLDFALAVEKVTTGKKDNLILNVDGTIAAVLVDLGFAVESLNGVFILARTIGLIGHWVDQKQQGSRLIRLYNYLIKYATPKRKEVPDLKTETREK